MGKLVLVEPLSAAALAASICMVLGSPAKLGEWADLGWQPWISCQKADCRHFPVAMTPQKCLCSELGLLTQVPAAKSKGEADGLCSPPPVTYFPAGMGQENLCVCIWRAEVNQLP